MAEFPGDKEFKNDSAATLPDSEIEKIAASLQPRVPPGPGGPGVDANPNEQPPDVSEPEVAEALTLVADLMYARTNADHWIITKEEKEMLGRRGKRVLDLFVKVNPAWLAVGTFGTGLAIVYGPRFAADAKARKAKAKAEKTEQKKED